MKVTNNFETEHPLKVNACTFVLTRGYRGLASWRYLWIILRNLFLWRVTRKNPSFESHFIFHEGNLGKVAQKVIQYASPLKLTFKSVKKGFIYPVECSDPVDNTRGYSLMCRFQSRDVWSELLDYAKAMRVDEDVLLLRIPEINKTQGFVTAALTRETHSATNKSLPKKIQSMGYPSTVYDHNFPHTQFFITEVAPWTASGPKGYIETLWSDPRGLEFRWGDIPILGTAMKIFKHVTLNEDSSIRYIHVSHFSLVKNGYHPSPKFVFDIRSPCRWIRLSWSRKLRRHS